MSNTNIEIPLQFQYIKMIPSKEVRLDEIHYFIEHCGTKINLELQKALLEGGV